MTSVNMDHWLSWTRSHLWPVMEPNQSLCCAQPCPFTWEGWDEDQAGDFFCLCLNFRSNWSDTCTMIICTLTSYKWLLHTYRVPINEDSGSSGMKVSRVFMFSSRWILINMLKIVRPVSFSNTTYSLFGQWNAALNIYRPQLSLILQSTPPPIDPSLFSSI